MEEKYLSETIGNDGKNIYCFIKNKVIFKIIEQKEKVEDTCALLLTSENVPHITVTIGNESSVKYLTNFIEIGDTYDNVNGFQKTLHKENGDEEVPLIEYFRSYAEEKLNKLLFENIETEHSSFIDNILKYDPILCFMVKKVKDGAVVDGVEQLTLEQDDFLELKKILVRNNAIEEVKNFVRTYNFVIKNIVLEIE